MRATLEKNPFNYSHIVSYECPMNTHKRPQQVISTPYDLRQHEKIGEIFGVIFTGVKV